MTITLNDKTETLPKEKMSIADLLEWKEIKSEGTAVAIDDRLVNRQKWTETFLTDGMNVTVISAAFGG